MTSLTIQFLGTSAARPIPRWGCDCLQCTEARIDSTARRTRSAILVNGTVLVDAGPDIYEQLQRLPYAELPTIDRIFLTHPHADHYLGLDDLASLRRISQLTTLPIYALEDSWDRIEEGFRYLIAAEMSEYDRRPFARRIIQLNQRIELPGDLSITLLDTHHTQPFTTAGVMIECGHRRAFYAPDFYQVSAEAVINADLLILDGAFLSREQMDEKYTPVLEEGQGRHRPIMESIAWAGETGASRVIFTHIGHLRLSNDQLRSRLPEDCDLAYDGMVIEL